MEIGLIGLVLVPIVIVTVVAWRRGSMKLVECPNCGKQMNPDATGCQNGACCRRR